MDPLVRASPKFCHCKRRGICPLGGWGKSGKERRLEGKAVDGRIKGGGGRRGGPREPFDVTEGATFITVIRSKEKRKIKRLCSTTRCYLTAFVEHWLPLVLSEDIFSEEVRLGNETVTKLRRRLFWGERGPVADQGTQSNNIAVDCGKHLGGRPQENAAELAELRLQFLTTHFPTLLKIQRIKGVNLLT